MPKKVTEKKVTRVCIVGKSKRNPAQISIVCGGALRIITSPSVGTIAKWSKFCNCTRGTIRPVLLGRIGWTWESR